MSTVTDLTEPARERLDDARRRAGSAGEHLKDRSGELREELDPALRRAGIGLWEAFQVLISALLVLPRLLVRLIGFIARVTVVVTNSCEEVSQRTQQVAARIPEPRGVRARRRVRAGLWLLAAFGTGLGIGWLLARSQRDDELIYDAPQVVAPAVAPEAPPPDLQADPTD